ncbi:MAG: adenosine deaminase [Spirochaetales bacterium]|nr:adenosine deaminase [Spirochaetales bacterium]
MADKKLSDKEVLKHFPKIELHRHLEGTYPLDRLYEMAKKNGLDVPDTLTRFKEENQFPANGEPNFLLFLSKFRNDWYRSLDDVAFITYHSVKTLAQDGIFYIELRFNPEHYAFFNNFDRAEVTKTIIDAAKKAAKEDGIRIRFLITLNRGKQTEDDLLSMYEQIKNVSSDVCGYDLAGDETHHPPAGFQKLFQRIHSDGFPSTIHAGEVSPSSQIWDAVKLLFANRIGHGTSTARDPELQKYLIDNDIILEQCLTSNRQTGSWINTETHPFGELFHKGVPVTLNSDDPHIQNTDLTDDYLLAIRCFDLSLDDLVKLNLTAIRGSFLPDKEKAALAKDYQAALFSFKQRFGF